MQEDIKPKSLEELDWTDEHAAGSARQVFAQVQRHAQDAVDWYLTARRSKRNCGRLTRLGAIVATFMAGVLPILNQIFLTDGKPAFEPAWASVFLAVAALLVLIDRFFGCSNAWMRYIATEHEIRRLLHEFQLDWEAERATWKGSTPTIDQVQKVLVKCKTFMIQIDTTIGKETATWMAEFQDTLKQLDETVKARSAIAELGGLNLEISNGDQCDDGWEVSIDDGSRTKYSGKTAALPGIQPGLRKVRVTGKIQGKPRQSEILVTITAGALSAVQITL